MAIQKEDLYKKIDQLDYEDQKTAYDFMEFLIERAKSKPISWQKIDDLEPDSEPLTKEEKEQLDSNEGYITREEAKREFGLQIDLP